MHRVIVAGLLFAPAARDPVPPPPPTPWALAGARPFKVCRDAERQAAAMRRATTVARGGASEDATWIKRARQCPHAVLTLTEAAQQEIVQVGTILRGVENWATDEPNKLDEVAREHAQRLGRALAWLDAAIEESARRGRRPPREALYYRAYALTSLGRTSEAINALEATAAAGDIESWRADRMAALVEIMSGDLARAIGLAEHAVRSTDTASNDATISRYILAFVLDRAGAPAFARQELRSLRRESDALTARDAVESVLPIHERLFLRALDATANDEESHALRLWDAYLSRPEPLVPERVLAKRHREELAPPP